MDKLSNILERTAWLPAVVLGLLVISVSMCFLYPSSLEFPMDDTYIHFIYAQNLADHGLLMFNDSSDVGIGSTSLLWVSLLALGYKLGLTLQITAKLLGISALTLVGIALFILLKSRWGTGLAFITSILIVLTGNLLWFALSGMETILFLAFGLSSLWAYRNQNWGLFGVLLGATVLTRPEGVALAFAVGLIEVLHHKYIPKNLWVTFSILLLICVPWFGYLYFRTGHLLPTSAVGKQMTSILGAQYVLEKTPGLGFISRLSVLLYLGSWFFYLLEFLFGGMTLPGPHLRLGGTLGNYHYTMSIWALVGIISVVFPIFWKVLKIAKRNKIWSRWMKDDRNRPFLILLLWCLFHNIAYIVVLPVPGTASRYGAINYVLIWIAICYVVFRYENGLKRIYYTSYLLVIWVSNVIYWNGVYDANLDHMENVRIAAAAYVKENIPQNEICAVSDIGAIRYFSQRPLLDLGGLIDPELGPVYFNGSLDQYIARNGVTCLVLPGRRSTTEDGWFDILEIMGVENSPLFELHPLALFQIDKDRWLRGYLATNNYQATVAIYGIEY